MVRSYSMLSGCRGALLAALVSVSALAKESSPWCSQPRLGLGAATQPGIHRGGRLGLQVGGRYQGQDQGRPRGRGLEGNPLYEQLPEEQRQQFERFFEKFRGQQPPRRQRPQPEANDLEGNPFYNGRGSGMVMREDGYILTNNHVVEDAEAILVVFKDGREVKAEVRGRDPESDLAVIQVTEKIPGLVPVKFADSDSVKVGEFAIAIGAPFDLEYSVTFGHVSAKGRQVEDMRTLSDQDFIQTDANINVGNSGGPLVNINSEVMGVNSMIRTSMGVGVGIGFAIPSNLAREIGNRLIEDGRFVRSWLGIGIADLREYRRFRDIDTKAKDGVVVRSIEPNGPAYGSELKPADVIVSVDGKPVATTQQLRSLISRKRPGPRSCWMCFVATKRFESR